MQSAPENVGNDRLFCWEQVNLTNPAFRLSQLFASREDSARLLSLYALFSMTEQICSHSSDEDLARSKLAWWRAECSAGNIRTSRHPIMQEFRRTGAIERTDMERLDQLFSGVEEQLEGSAPNDISDLKSLSAALQLPRAALEMEICGLDGTCITRPEMLAQNGILQLLRAGANRPGQGAYWWVPLKLMARHGVSRNQLIDAPDSLESIALFGELLEEVVSWPRAGFDEDANVVQGAGARNYFAISSIYFSQINRLRKVSPSTHANELGRTRMADAAAAWRGARRLRV